MSKLVCGCGHIISDVQVPNEVTGCLVSDKDSDTFFGFVTSATAELLEHVESGRLDAWRAKHFAAGYPEDVPPAEMLHDVLHARFMALQRALMECDSCGRLYVQRAADSNQYRGYQPDPGDPAIPHVLGPVGSAD